MPSPDFMRCLADGRLSRPCRLSSKGESKNAYESNASRLSDLVRKELAQRWESSCRHVLVVGRF